MKTIMKALIAGTMLSSIFSINSNAQIQVGSATHTKGPGKISEESMNAFKKSTTYFILQAKDYANQAAFEAAIAKVWTVTPFKIIQPSEMSNLNENTSSFFFFGGFVTTRKGSSSSTFHPHLSYDLFMLSKNKKGKTEQNMLGKFLLHLDGESYRFVARYANGNSQRFSEKVIPFLYNEAEMQNWSPLMLSGYLKVINDGLAAGNLRSVFEEYTNKDAVKALQTQTLYVPNYVNTKFNMFTGGEKDTEDDDSDLKSAYSFPSQYTSLSDLGSNAEKSPSGLYYLSYIKSSTDKFVSVFNSKTGEMIYTAYTPMSYNFKLKDLKRIGAKAK